jgi:hypothetical protein
MQYMLLIYDDPQVWEGFSEEETNAIMGEYFAYTEELRAAGAYVAGDALQPTGSATTIRLRDGEQLVTDGPFAETKECLAGFYMIEAKDLDEALQIAARIPPAAVGSVEVRPVRPIREAPNAHQLASRAHESQA